MRMAIKHSWLLGFVGSRHGYSPSFGNGFLETEEKVVSRKEIEDSQTNLALLNGISDCDIISISYLGEIDDK